MRYRVAWKYQSGLGGPWAEGEALELDPAIAEAVNRDSPGVLVPAAVAGSPDLEGALASATGKRQVKAARNRAVTHPGADR